MSVIGTGVASGVAQTSFQAQQVARKPESEQREREVRRVRQTIEPHLHPHDEADDEIQLRIEDQPLPDRASQQDEASDGPPAAAENEPKTPDQQLYRHLDVQG